MMKRFIPFTLFFLFIIWVISQANSYGTNYLFEWVDNVPYKDKVGHFTLYGILAVLFDLALNKANWHVKSWGISKAAVFVLTFAILEEFTQIWIPARNFDWVDGLADLIGIFTMVYASRWFLRRRPMWWFREMKLL